MGNKMNSDASNASGNRDERLGWCVRRSAEQQIVSRRCTTRSTYPKREEGVKKCAIDFTSKAD